MDTLRALIEQLQSYRTQKDTISSLTSGQSMLGLHPLQLALIGALRSGRPVGLEPEGDIATVKMGTFRTPQGYMNAPTYWGQDLPAGQELRIAERNNYPLKTYPTEQEAEKAAILNSRKTGENYRWPGYGLRMYVNPIDWGK